MTLSQGLYSDDGKELLPPVFADAPIVLKIVRPAPICPADVVGFYDFDKIIGAYEFEAMVAGRNACMWPEAVEEDLAALKIPTENLTAGWCIDVWPGDDATDEQIAEAWEAAYARIRRKAAAELHIRRKLREQRIGVDMSDRSSPPRRESGIARMITRNMRRERLPGVEAKARELCIAAGRDPDEVPSLTCDFGTGGWPDYVVRAMEALGYTDADIDDDQ